MTGAAAPLAIGASSVSPSGDPDRAIRAKSRAHRYKLRRAARHALPAERVAKCGRVPTGQMVDVRRGDYGCAYSGLSSCGSVWLCPVCAAKIAEQRRIDVRDTIRAHRAAGGSIRMATFTIPHNRIQTASELRSLVANGWRKVQGGKKWIAAKTAAGVVGSVRALEVTHGGNGWHPHLHVLFFIEKDADPEAVEAFGFFAFERWAKIVSDAGYGECTAEAFSWQDAAESDDDAVGDYVSKWGADRELTNGHKKRARAGRSPWQILEDIAAGDRRSVMLFRDYAAAFKGARQLTWSRGLREMYGLRDLQTDEQILSASEQVEERLPMLGSLTRKCYRQVVKRKLEAELLDVADERGAWPDVIRFLSLHGIRFDDPPDRQSGDRDFSSGTWKASGFARHGAGDPRSVFVERDRGCVS